MAFKGKNNIRAKIIEQLNSFDYVGLSLSVANNSIGFRVCQMWSTIQRAFNKKYKMKRK